MCIGFSCVVTRAGKVLWDKMSNSHEEIKKQNKLKDDKLADRDIVNCEVLPLGNLTSGKAEDYEIKVDEEGTLPKWWTDNEAELKGKVMGLWLGEVLPGWIENGVGGDLDLRGTGITSLGNLTSVGGYLDLQGTGVTSLCKLTSVGGSLYLRGTGVTSLGNLTSVGGDLDLRGTGITSLGKTKVSGTVYGLKEAK